MPFVAALTRVVVVRDDLALALQRLAFQPVNAAVVQAGERLLRHRLQKRKTITMEIGSAG